MQEGYTSDDSHSSQHSVEVSQVEMLLEAYFMHFDSIWDRLQDLMDNVGDTEAVVGEGGGVCEGCVREV